MKNRSQNTCDDTSTSVGSYPGIYDIQAPVMSMSRFKNWTPRKTEKVIWVSFENQATVFIQSSIHSGLVVT